MGYHLLKTSLKCPVCLQNTCESLFFPNEGFKKVECEECEYLKFIHFKRRNGKLIFKDKSKGLVLNNLIIKKIEVHGRPYLSYNSGEEKRIYDKSSFDALWESLDQSEIYLHFFVDGKLKRIKMETTEPIWYSDWISRGVYLSDSGMIYDPFKIKKQDRE